MRRHLSSMVVVCLIMALGSAAYATPPLTYTQVAGAEPDECFNGPGMPYIPFDDCLDGEPKRNQTFAWGMTKCGNKIFIGTAANVGCWGSGIGAMGGEGGVVFEPGVSVCEGSSSQFPGVPDLIKPIYGDWRPPRVWVHCTDANEQVNQTLIPVKSRLVDNTIGWRAAGSCNGVVLLAGPDLIGEGINMVAIDCETLKVLGVKYFPQWPNIRRFVKHKGVLYCGVQNGLGGGSIGGGSILRWRGNKRRPFRFEVVGSTDNEVATLAVCNDRLMAGTWPPNPVSTITGAIQVLYQIDIEPAGIYMSPKIPSGGLTAEHTQQWKKIWAYDDYEAEPALVQSAGMGDLKCFGDCLYFGTMSPSSSGVLQFNRTYGQPRSDLEAALVEHNTSRRFLIIKACNFDNKNGPTFELLYGDEKIPVFRPNNDPYALTLGYWELQQNKMGVAPTYGRSGFGVEDNIYVWSMACFRGQLYVGTGINADGGQLWFFPHPNSRAFRVGSEGLTSPTNIGQRNMVECPGEALYLGTGSFANLAPDGGWQLIRAVSEHGGGGGGAAAASNHSAEEESEEESTKENTRPRFRRRR